MWHLNLLTRNLQIGQTYNIYNWRTKIRKLNRITKAQLILWKYFYFYFIKLVLVLLVKKKIIKNQKEILNWVIARDDQIQDKPQSSTSINIVIYRSSTKEVLKLTTVELMTLHTSQLITN